MPRRTPQAAPPVLQAAVIGPQRGAEIQCGAPYLPARRLNLSLADFEILGRAGDGSFSTVVLARHKESGVEYAIKIINKHVVMRNKIVEYIKNERNILDKLTHEGVVQLKFTFQDEDSLCGWLPGRGRALLALLRRSWSC